ncbi:patatin-like phospholipase family protein [Bradyrhizobium sp. ARR65]|uniref:patatin-like phospholipase family protein n=1 Tax=Bradyrhizobium sp. ARR65 TaxID=1040989 RepID=UPI000A053CCD|nr:patatin-like phospholipase family protein [Bradyrhizobium sp. ARR65]
MNENDSSGAQRGLTLQSTTPSEAREFRSGASALLAAADIWSTNSAPTAPTEAVAVTPEAAPAQTPEAVQGTAKPATVRGPRPSELAAEARFFFNSIGKRARQAQLASQASAMVGVAPSTPEAMPGLADVAAWPPRKLSLALQGGGSFAAFTWGVLERLLEEPACAFDAISGASAGSVNAVLLASGLVEGGRERARTRLAQFWNRMVDEASFRSLMLLGGFSPAGSSVAFGAALRSGQFDPLDIDPLRRVLARHVNFEALRAPSCPKLLLGATRVRDGAARIFRNSEITADVVLASTCPPLVHCAVEIDGDAHWDGGFATNPPLVDLVQESTAAELLIVQVTPSRDSYVPITGAAIDRRLDQITANASLNAEVAALEWARGAGASAPRISRIAAEDEIDGLAQRSAVDLGRAFVMALHRSGRTAADRWLRGATKPVPAKPESAPVQPSREPALV